MFCEKAGWPEKNRTKDSGGARDKAAQTGRKRRRGQL